MRIGQQWTLAAPTCLIKGPLLQFYWSRIYLFLSFGSLYVFIHLQPASFLCDFSQIGGAISTNICVIFFSVLFLSSLKYSSESTLCQALALGAHSDQQDRGLSRLQVFACSIWG